MKRQEMEHYRVAPWLFGQEGEDCDRQAENFVWDRYVHWLGHVVQIHVCRLE